MRSRLWRCASARSITVLYGGMWFRGPVTMQRYNKKSTKLKKDFNVCALNTAHSSLTRFWLKSGAFEHCLYHVTLCKQLNSEWYSPDNKHKFRQGLGPIQFRLWRCSRVLRTFDKRLRIINFYFICVLHSIQKEGLLKLEDYCFSQVSLFLWCTW